eukprot:630888-Hanusia_phi.AAC.4
MPFLPPPAPLAPLLLLQFSSNSPSSTPVSPRRDLRCSQGQSSTCSLKSSRVCQEMSRRNCTPTESLQVRQAGDS